MSIEKLRAQFNKKYNTEIMSKGSTIPEMERIPTGSLSLDVEVGGGLPAGRITTISGHYSDGKTAVVLKIVAEYQRKWPNKDVVWIDAEGAWDSSWAKTLGVDPDSVFVVHPEYSQQAFDITEQCITADVGLLVVDSIAALVPKEEAEATMEDWQVGLAARINNKFIRRTHSSLNDKRGNDVPPTVILINQLRENIGYGQPESEPGGKGIGFAASLRIKVRRGELYPKPKSNYDTTVVPKAQQIKFFVEKNKCGIPFRRGSLWLYFDTLDEFRPKGCYDRLEEIIRYAKKYNIITQRSSAFDLVDPDTGEIQTFKGSTAVANYIRENQRTREWVEKEVFKRVYAEQTEVLLDTGQESKQEGKEGSEETGNEETTQERSDTVGEAGSNGSNVLDTTQMDLETVTHSKASRS